MSFLTVSAPLLSYQSKVGRIFDGRAGTKTYAVLFLAKMHKDHGKWPTPTMPRDSLIVSDCDGESYRIAQFINFHINPLSTRHVDHHSEMLQTASAILTASFSVLVFI